MTTDGLRRSEHYADFEAGRVRPVRTQAMETVGGRTRGRDFSASKWQIRLRAYRTAVATGQTFLLDVVKTKVVGTASAGDTGISTVDVLFLAAHVGDAYIEEVAVDTDTVDATTPSGKREYALDRPWPVTIRQAPGTA